MRLSHNVVLLCPQLWMMTNKNRPALAWDDFIVDRLEDIEGRRHCLQSVFLGNL